jgi:large-conductance mechanosensitive channel
MVAIPFGKPNFDTALVLTLNDAEIRFGAFITAAVSFVSVAFTLFLILKAYNRASSLVNGSPEAVEEPAPPSDEVVVLTHVLAEIKGMRADLHGPPTSAT